jgi:hypothetical protein
MNTLDHISESLETIFWVKHPDADPDPGSGVFLTLDPGSGLRKIRIRDGKNSDRAPKQNFSVKTVKVLLIR